MEVGEVSPLQQGAVEGGQRSVEEGIRAVGRVIGSVGEEVHLQQSLDQVAQHLSSHGGMQTSEALGFLKV